MQSSSAGPYIFVLGEGFLLAHQNDLRIRYAWPLRSDPADSFGFLGTAKWVRSCSHPICVETLPLSKVTGLAGGIMLLSKSGPTDICPHPLLAI